jgi:UDP-glucose:(heptosyl)LPS alpha-1,3-glucosyltransferase
VKIGLVLEKFDPQKGGLEHWTWQFSQSLLARGHEVHVIAFEFHPAVADEIRIIAHRVEMPRSRLERAAALETRLRSLHLDVIHDMGNGWHADIFHPHGGSTMALWEHNLMRIPKWRQIRFWRERRYRELSEIERRQHSKSGALIVAVSRMVQRHFETLHHVKAERLRLIYNGVDCARFSPAHREKHREPMRQELGIKPDETLFLMLAHNLLLKNAPTLIRAAARLIAAGNRARVVIAGGKKPERFAQLASKFDVSRSVSFLGQMDDPVPLYSTADIFVHPTWYDPCSLVTLEACASALPVITTQFNGASELMSHGVEGYVFGRPDDVATLAAHMAELHDHETLRKRMGEKGRALALRHSFEAQTENFLQLYEEIVFAKQAAQK